MHARPRVVLKKGEDRRVRSGHLWIFSNEVDRVEPSGSLELSGIVDVYSHSGAYLGTGIHNAHTLLAVRLLKHGKFMDFREYLEEQILESIGLPIRKKSEGNSGFRLVHSEGDGLPGLVVDVFSHWLSVQFTTRVMEEYKNVILEILDRLLTPKGVRIDNGVSIRLTEGLPLSPDEYRGEVPDTLQIPVGNMMMRFPYRSGQKTGLFLDQKDNVLALSRFLGGQKVLDAFCYVGGWSAAAARAGATSVYGVDESVTAIECYEENLSPFAREISVGTARSDFFEWASLAVRRGEQFDAVILDPPAFIKSRKKKEEGRRKKEEGRMKKEEGRRKK
jgi:23S rRNA (cytosine1962-C5)-methyltransferase